MAEHTVVDVLPKDAIQSIDDPTFSSSFDGRSGEEVIVVETADGARAYPTRILQNHEIVNDVVNDDPIAVTWCPLCASAVVYDRRVGDRTLTLGVSGKLADNDLVLYDRETGTEWKQSSGDCLSGELPTLTVRPAATMTWPAFTERYPDGMTLQPPTWGSADYATDRFEEYMHSDRIGPGGNPRLRDAIENWPFDFHPKAPTLGLTIDGDSRGYPGPVVDDSDGVVTDTLGGTDIVVFGSSDGIFAYKGNNFDYESLPADGQFEADGTAWDGVTGRATDGRRLSRLPSRRSFAFTWRDDHGADSFYGV